MGILDPDTGAESQPVQMSDLVETTQLPENTAPVPALRNKAAQTAALSSDPASAQANYNQMMLEASQGSDATQKALNANIDSSVKAQDFQSVMHTLSDTSVSPEIKAGVIANYQKASFLSDKATTLQTNLLQKPASGESQDGETARISTANAVGEIYQARTAVQGLANKFIAEQKSKDVVGATSDFGASLIPFSNSIRTAREVSNLDDQSGTGSIGSTLGALFQPGQSVVAIREKLAALPPEQRVPFAQQIIKAIKDSNGIFGNDNQYEQFNKVDQIFQEGGYSGVDQFVDNVAPLLDVIGVGSAAGSIRKALGKIGTVGKVAEAGAVASKVEPGAFDLKQSFGFNPAEGKVEPTGTVTGGPTANGSQVEPTLEGTKTPVTQPQTVPSTLGGSGVAPEAAVPNNGALLTPEGTKTAVQTTQDAVPSLLGGSGTTAKPVKQVAALLKPVVDRADVESRIARNAPVAVDNPASVLEVAQQSNPEQVRNIVSMIASAPDDQAAEALAGLSKNDAVSSAIVPKAATESGEITTKTANADSVLADNAPDRPDPKIIDVLWDTGATHFNPAEKAAARARFVNDFENADGLVMNTAMSSTKLDGGRIVFNGMYETPGGGFSNAEQAVEQAKYAFRNYGIDDSNITVYAKQGLDHVPVALDDVRGVEGSYKIGLSVAHEIDPTDVGALQALGVKRNPFDRIPFLSKFGVNRYVLDAASMLHPQLTQAGEVAADQGARLDKLLLDKATKYSDGYNALPAVAGDSAKARRSKIDDYIREANYNGIGYDQGDLIARGFTTQEQSVIKDWRSFWDTHFHLENRDLVRTLDSQGYKIFKNANTELYAKPIAKNSNLGRFYDPATDSVRTFGAGELDQLYNNGGTMARLRRPANFAGEEAEFMISRETPQEYLRGFNGNDNVLNYRKGYFQLQYNAPKFVDKIERTAGGAEKSRKTVAVGKDTPEVQHWVNRQMANNPGDEYVIRNDSKALANGSDEAWDINSSGGRIGQRHRGQLLEDASGLNRLGDGSYIVNPVDSAINAARSVAGRVTSRPMIEAAQERFLQQFKQYMPADGIGGVRYPKNISEIAAKGDVTSKAIADARSTYQYIEFLKNGYSNGLDQSLKATFNAIADGFGNAGWGGLERGARALAGRSLTGDLKSSVFMTYIGSNPLRQWIIQPYQMVRTFSYNPEGWLMQRVPKYFAEMTGKIAGLTGETEFTKFMDASGLLNAVDKSNLVRGSLLQAAEGHSGLEQGIRSIPSTLRKIGFDVGESSNLMGHGAAVFDRYKQLGRDLNNKDVRDKAFGEIRALSYGMNSAGDMPYNSNAAAFVFQFLQMPHKAITQITNRRLDFSTRLQMAVGDVALFGAPIATVQALTGKDVLPDNPTARDALQHGLLVTMYNHVFNSISDDYKGIDFSALNPYSMDGWIKMAQSIFGGSQQGVIANSPIGTLTNGRFENAIKSVGRYFNIIPDWDKNDPTTFTSMLNDIATVSSGWNNFQKAKLAYTLGQRRDQYGSLIDDNTSTPEQIAQLFGFGAASQQQLFDLSQKNSEIEKDHKTRVLSELQDIKRYYAQRLSQGDSDPAFITGVTGAAMSVYADDPQAMYIINQSLKQSQDPKDLALMAAIIKRSDLPDPKSIHDDIDNIPNIDDKQRAQMHQIVKDSVDAKQKLADINKQRGIK